MNARGPREKDRWATSSERAELIAIYRAADALFEGWACGCALQADARANAPDCCHFGVTGREPYPSAVELEEVRFGVRAAGITLARPREARRLPSALGERRCPLLARDGRCRIYGSRPFGCRTFFCEQAVAPAKTPREALRELSGRIADLSARFAPRDPRPRPFVRALEEVRA